MKEFTWYVDAVQNTCECTEGVIDVNGSCFELI